MKIISAIVVQGFGADQVMLHTDLPEATYPWDTKLCVTFTASAGRGPQYVTTHWPGVPVEIVARDSSTPKYKD